MMRLVDLLREATKSKATDIYLIAGAVPCMSLEGRYVAMPSAQGQRLGVEQLMSFAREITSDKQWRELEEGLELNMAYMSPETDRFRVNMFWQRGSLGMVARRVVSEIPTLRQLGLPPVMREIALEERGIVLLTGSTGSGKSTTLASMIDYRNHLRSGHIVTIEDPVEFVYRHRRSIVSQREVGIDTKNFHEALRNTLRQAPQVICIGELRDAETVQFAMHASETGHLVFTTLHSTNVPLTIERVLHFYPGEMKEQILIQLSLNLKAIFCQRLVQRIGGGRVAAVEVLVNTPRMQDLISRGDLGAVRMALMAENPHGIINFDKALYRLCRQGKITRESALQAADSANDLQMKFKGIGIEPGSSWEDLSDGWEQVGGDYDPPESALHRPRPRDPQGTGAYSNESAPPLPAPRQPGNIARRPPQEAPGRSSPDSVPRRYTPQAPPGAPPRSAGGGHGPGQPPRRPPPRRPDSG